MSTTIFPAVKPSLVAVRAEQHFLHVGGIRHHEEEDVSGSCDGCARRTDRRNCQVVGYRAARGNRQFVTRRLQVLRHRGAHDAKTNETDFHVSVFLECVEEGAR